MEIIQHRTVRVLHLGKALCTLSQQTVAITIIAVLMLWWKLLLLLSLFFPVPREMKEQFVWKMEGEIATSLMTDLIVSDVLGFSPRLAGDWQGGHSRREHLTFP